jgi:hypothetical protein
MLDKIKPTKHALERITYVPQTHMIADILFRYGSDDHRGRLRIPSKEVAAVAAEARISGAYRLARNIERAARVAFVMDGNTLITLFYISEPEHLSCRYNYRRSRKRAAQHRRQRIG